MNSIDHKFTFTIIKVLINACIANAKDGFAIIPLTDEDTQIAKDNYAKGIENLIDMLERSNFNRINEYPILMRRDKEIVTVISPSEIFVTIGQTEEEVQNEINKIIENHQEKNILSKMGGKENEKCN